MTEAGPAAGSGASRRPPRRARLPTPVRALAWIGVVACAGCASSSGAGPGGTGSGAGPAAMPPAAGDARASVGETRGPAVRLRLTPFDAAYRVAVTSIRLDEDGALLEERDQEVALRLVVGPDVASGEGVVAIDVESLRPAREPESTRYPADSLGVHPVNEWRGGSWMAPLLPLVGFPPDPVQAGDDWTVRRRARLTTSELEGGSTVRYRVESVDGGRVTLSFTGRASGNRRVEQGEMGTGRPVILAASTRTRGEAVVDGPTGRVLRLTRTDDLTVTVEPLDARDAAGEGRQVLQRLRMEVAARIVEEGGAGGGAGR